MKRFPELKINQFQLAVLLDEEERHFYNVVIDNYVYCAQCRGLAKEGVDVEAVYLTNLNDIRIEGKCRKCRGEVGRLFEFGAKKEFYEKACRLRESIKTITDQTL
jgi:hypothetical protein